MQILRDLLRNFLRQFIRRGSIGLRAVTCPVKVVMLRPITVIGIYQEHISKLLLPCHSYWASNILSILISIIMVLPKLRCDPKDIRATIVVTFSASDLSLH